MQTTTPVLRSLPLLLPREILAGLMGLHSTDFAFTPIDPKGGIMVDVLPGDYHFEVASQDQPYFVRQVIRGGKAATVAAAVSSLDCQGAL